MAKSKRSSGGRTSGSSKQPRPEKKTTKPASDVAQSVAQGPDSAASFLNMLSTRPADLLLGAPAQAPLDMIKGFLDPIAGTYSIFEAVHLEGLDVEQVWAQAQMIVEGVLDKVVQEEVPEMIERGVVKAESFSPVEVGDSEDEDESESEEEEEEEEESIENDTENAPEAKGSDESDFDVDMEQDDYQDSDIDMEAAEPQNDDEEQENEESETEEEESETEAAKELNDDFFKLESFKKQIAALDKLAENDEDDGNEEVDYFADPSAPAATDDGDGMDALKYNDFFAAPKKKRDYKRPRSSKPKKAPEPEFEGFGLEADEQEYEDAMDAVRKDLFAEEESGPSEKEVLSTLEKQQLELQRQISRYEAENIGAKTWEMKGEAKAKDRPLNSLLESELDFERSRKPAPVITQEVTDDLEELIKKRIKKGDFDDLPRRLPDHIQEFRPSKLADVQETKSKKSLGELYEQDLLRETDPDAYEAQQNEQLSAAHAEIIGMFNSLTRKLDSLSAWHYTPKAAAPSISIVAAAPAIAMEDAQPTAQSADAMLAPHEVYKPEQGVAGGAGRDEVIGPDGLPVSRAEMSREEKKRLRRRVKTRKAKAFNEREERQRSMAQKKGSKAEIMETLKKGNVTVIDKKGEKRDMSGKLKSDKGPVKINQLRL